MADRAWRGRISPRSWSPATRDAAALTLLALGANLIQLGSKSLVHDEAGTVLYARLSLRSLLAMLGRSDLNMALYHLVMNVWVGIFGESEAAVRVPSALFGALAVGALYFLGRRLFGRAAGVVASLLLALNPFMVEFAQTARSYTLLVFLVTLSSLFFVRAVERPTRRNLAGYALVSALAVYSHYFAAYVLAAHAVALVVWRPRAALSREWLSVAAIIAFLCVPTLLVVYGSGAVGRFNWIAPPSLRDVGAVLVELAGSSRVALALLLLSGCWGAAIAAREHRPWPQAFVALWLIVPLALSFLVSLALPMFLSYYLIICLPPLLLFGAAGIVRVRPKILAVVLLAPLVIVSESRLLGLYRREAVQNWREAARYSLASLREGDGLLFFPDTAVKPFGFYARQFGKEMPMNLAALPFDERQRIWFVIRESDIEIMRPQYLELESRLRHGFRLEEHREFGKVAVDLYVR